ncbi:MAG: DUF2752 domain-containing protein [Sedimentisphaerales bacterium]|nr:DUF2752 domain-containing protein [Sedimentisphaerales bacterium]
MQSSQQINKSKFIFRASGRQRIIAAVIFIAIGAFFGFFSIAAYKNVDMGQHLGRCGFKTMYGLPCPTCGMTTATLAFAQGRILEAFYIQPACGLLCSIFVFAGIISFIIAVFGINFVFVSRFFAEVKIRHIVLALIIIIASGWAVTLARAIAQK